MTFKNIYFSSWNLDIFGLEVQKRKKMSTYPCGPWLLADFSNDVGSRICHTHLTRLIGLATPMHFFLMISPLVFRIGHCYLPFLASPIGRQADWFSPVSNSNTCIPISLWPTYMSSSTSFVYVPVDKNSTKDCCA